MVSGRAKIAEWIKRLVLILFALIIGYLLVASIFSTCYLGRYSYMNAAQVEEINVEHTFYIQDNYVQHIVVFMVFSSLLVLLRTKGGNKSADENNRRIPWLGIAACITAGIVAVLIVLKGQYPPKFDQKHVVEAAAALNAHDYSDFETGGYLFIFPFQMGIVMYFQVLSRLFGSLNYIAFEIVNAVWIVFSYYFFMKIAGMLWDKEHRCKTQTAVLCLLFAPFLMYTTFLYGTVVGMAFALLSFYTVLLYESNPKVHYLLLAGVSIGLATVFKSNYTVYMIAELIYILFKLLADKHSEKRKIFARLLLMLTIIICFAIGRFGVNQSIKNANQGEEVKGIPMMAWVVMGLQDGKCAPGWYNAYNNSVYERNDYDYDRTQEAVMDDLKSRVSGMAHRPLETTGFFVKKVSAQWNNPTFQSVWILEGRSDRESSVWILQEKGRAVYTFLANLLQTWILAGTFLYAVLRCKKSSMEEMILPITFVGGFVFHLFWEAEGLYAILYFPLLLPLCVCGYKEWSAWLHARRSEIVAEGWKSPAGAKLKKKIWTGAVIMVAFCALSYSTVFAKLFARNDDTGIFNTYTQEIVNESEARPEQ
ncbi:MAG: glycosyltransferase family 39 protein [Lachnospiraceae bacterium]|nr:glycosyltransferase family 39 protein [Lachnospiraceae bacterium]